jgi:hypothetical protein
LLAVETVTTWTFCAVVGMLDTLLAIDTAQLGPRTRGDAGHDGKSCCCELHFESDVIWFFCWSNESMVEVNFVRNLILSSVYY